MAATLKSPLSDDSRRAIDGTTPGGVIEDIDKLKKDYRKDGDRLITPEERRKLELRLHRMLVWVGVLTPFEFELGRKKLPLHEIVWDLLAKDCLTEDEKEYVRKLIMKISAHEKVDEEVLHNNELTEREAKKIFREASGLMRAILSLKSLVGQKNTCTIKHNVNRRRVEEAQSWLNFLKQIT
jgi:hypothetical protein